MLFKNSISNKELKILFIFIFIVPICTYVLEIILLIQAMEMAAE